MFLQGIVNSSRMYPQRLFTLMTDAEGNMWLRRYSCYSFVSIFYIDFASGLLALNLVVACLELTSFTQLTLVALGPEGIADHSMLSTHFTFWKKRSNFQILQYRFLISHVATFVNRWTICMSKIISNFLKISEILEKVNKSQRRNMYSR